MQRPSWQAMLLQSSCGQSAAVWHSIGAVVFGAAQTPAPAIGSPAAQVKPAQQPPISRPHGSPAPRHTVGGPGTQYWAVQTPPRGAQVLQLQLQQYSPMPQVTALHASPQAQPSPVPGRL